MRSKKAELEDVVKQFEAWRAKPHGRLIPEELWKAALGLLDRYAPSTICSHLRVNAARFKQVRESGGAVVGEKRFKGHGRTGATGRSPRTVQDRSAAERVTALAPSGNAFVELPQFGMGFLCPREKRHTRRSAYRIAPTFSRTTTARTRSIPPGCVARRLPQRACRAEAFSYTLPVHF